MPCLRNELDPAVSDWNTQFFYMVTRSLRSAYCKLMPHPLVLFNRDDIGFVDLNPSQEYKSVKYQPKRVPHVASFRKPFLVLASSLTLPNSLVYLIRLASRGDHGDLYTSAFVLDLSDVTGGQVPGDDPEELGGQAQFDREAAPADDT